jgi:hypothetical protein
MTVSADINGLRAHKESGLGVMDAFQETKGDWSMKFDVETDTSSNRAAEPNAQGNGIIVQKAVQTPSNMHVTCYVPAELAEKNPTFVLLDGSGNRVMMEVAKMNTQEDGSQLQEMIFNTSQADQFVMQVFDKNAVGDGNGEVPLITEISFSMGE